jgi:alpha-tubulin suppressor-like RCC1 family protein
MLTSSGRVFSWGRNFYGQLGNGNNTTSSTPIEITSKFYLSNDEYIIFIEMGNYHNSAITNNGRLFTWGPKGQGELGNNTKERSSLPIDITNNFELDNEDRIIETSFGGDVSSALTTSGKLFVWGNNVFGEQGNGSSSIELLPNEITENFNLQPNEKISSIFFSGFTSAAYTSNNRLFMWGYNLFGQFGNGTTLNSNVPIEVNLSL